MCVGCQAGSAPRSAVCLLVARDNSCRQWLQPVAEGLGGYEGCSACEWMQWKVQWVGVCKSSVKRRWSVSVNSSLMGSLAKVFSQKVCQNSAEICTKKLYCVKKGFGNSAASFQKFIKMITSIIFVFSGFCFWRLQVQSHCKSLSELILQSWTPSCRRTSDSNFISQFEEEKNCKNTLTMTLSNLRSLNYIPSAQKSYRTEKVFSVFI